MRALTAMGISTAIVVAGCYRTHTRGDDSGPSIDAAEPIDGRVLDVTSDAHVVELLDAPVDAGDPARCECCPGVTIIAIPGFGCRAVCAGVCRCAQTPPSTVCMRAAVAGAPIDLEMMPIDGCLCGQAAQCSVRDDGNLQISHEICPGVPACDVCETPVPSRCTAPAQVEGRHAVFLGPTGGGGRLFDLDVLSSIDPERDADVCVRSAPHNCGRRSEPAPFASDRACHPSSVPTGTQASIRLEEACDDDTQPGHCTVSVRGSVITVRPTRVHDGCHGRSTPACAHPVHECITPALRDGRYSVIVEGLEVTDDGPPSTIDVSPSGGVSVETCRGSRS